MDWRRKWIFFTLVKCQKNAGMIFVKIKKALGFCIPLIGLNIVKIVDLM